MAKRTIRVVRQDAISALRDLPDASVDAVVTDPPYGLSNTDPGHVVETLSRWFAGDREYLPDSTGFAGSAWDAFVPPPAVWDECLRVLRPGGHLLAFAGSRTHDLMGLSVRLAGFEVRDSITWVYRSGFPKTLDVGRSVTELRERRGEDDRPGETPPSWDGWGTALKPASEPIVVARKPFAGTLTENVLTHGTGALNVDATRVGTSGATRRGSQVPYPKLADGTDDRSASWARTGHEILAVEKGRWPPNVVLDAESAEVLDAEGALGAGLSSEGGGEEGDSASFFPVFRYEAKPSARERPVAPDGTTHPTVKPLGLIRWLVRLVTPPGGVVLDCFAGSGTTGEAAYLEGFSSILVEREAAYVPLIEARVSRVEAEATLRVVDEGSGVVVETPVGEHEHGLFEGIL